MSDVNKSQFWDEVYEEGNLPWDMRQATAVFQRIAEEKLFTPGAMIVLGAGRGYDARLFARHGFTVTAVDFAAGAVREMQALAEPDAPVTILQSDLFTLPQAMNQTFDYLLEYTCYCAIDPARRPEYAQLVGRLLKPGGIYIALAFPIGNRPGGPPFAVQPDEMIRELTAVGLTLTHREFPPESHPKRKGFEELIILTKASPMA